MLDSELPSDLKVSHKTAIKVDEEGTEAAAATIVRGTPAMTGSPEPTPPPVKVIIFDRPFAFFLRHSESGAIFMLGRVERPEEVRD